MKARIALLFVALVLAGCVAVPVGPGDPYGYGYGYGYQGPSVYVAPPAVSLHYRYGGGYHRRHW